MVNPIQSSQIPSLGLRSRKKRIIIVAIITLLVALAMGLGFFLFSKSPGNEQAQKLYVETEGYKHNDAVGDAIALFFKDGNKTPFDYKGTKVVQACNILSINDVRELGLKTSANPSEQAFERVYFDGEGKGVLKPARYELPRAEDANSCRYNLEQSGLVVVNMHQPPYTSADALVNEVVKHYTQLDPIGELNLYEWKLGNVTLYIIGRGDTGVQISLTSSVPAEKVRPLLENITQNFVRERANPRGAPVIFIESPLLGQSYADSCKLLTADSVKQTFGAEASPLVKQGYGMSVGVRRVAGETFENYVVNYCERWAEQKEEGELGDRFVGLHAGTYSSAEGAKGWINFEAPSMKERSAVSELGDQAVYVRDDVLGETLFVRKGSVVLEFSFKDNRQILGKDKLLQLLVPVAKESLSRLES